MTLIDIRHNPEPPILTVIKVLRKAREKATGGKETRLL